jgi:hypothetical protein
MIPLPDGNVETDTHLGELPSAAPLSLKPRTRRYPAKR